jgi:DNA-binding IclR family transcriptional regulator
MPGPIQSIERAAAILRLLAGGSGRLGVSEIADSLGLARGTAHGILRTLQGVGFVEQDDATGKYQLGARLLHLGTSYLDVNELRSRAINWADALAARSGEAVRLGTLLEGKVLLAYDASAAATSGRGLLEPYTRRTITSAKVLSRALAEVRDNGWAAEVEEMTVGEASVAVPIRGHGGLVVGAMGISGAAERVCDVRGQPKSTLVSYVRDAARAVSRDLGASRW